ncbi:uncharacterized protein LOC104893325 [Beta vulgaris subsp. vulgaris]|uniref:uncharacterized protein LOC104893325 n=1 Tax=Beta vulgaris subsp. vulgaris TaxID=3555 RepID=UPI00053FC6E3|nr:uncharacterized protein LOC104893325 [Beta vulgaris subsp. vulgaris]
MREDRKGIEDAFIEYYKELLGTAHVMEGHISKTIIQEGKVINRKQQIAMCAEFTDADIKAALRDIGDNKAPGPDWVNTTNLCLIPKIEQPKDVTQFRPIACCNVLYKIISKLMCTRLAAVLPSIIDEVQSAFAANRRIMHNILICQDILKHYKRKSHPPRWKRGLRQGDPISPLLFLIAMEYHTRILRKMGKKHRFEYHHRCKELSLTRLVFADDLMLLSKGIAHLVVVLMVRALKAFAQVSGLQANLAKTAIYYGNVKEEIQERILQLTGYTKG